MRHVVGRVEISDGPAGHTFYTTQLHGLVRCECGDVGDVGWLEAHVHMRRMLAAKEVLDVSRGR